MRAVLGGAKKAVNKATTAFGSAAQEITGKQIFQPGTPYNTVVDALTTSETCTSLARRLWYSFAAEGEQVVHLQDFEEVLRSPEEAREAMILFDRVLPSSHVPLSLATCPFALFAIVNCTTGTET